MGHQKVFCFKYRLCTYSCMLAFFGQFLVDSLWQLYAALSPDSELSQVGTASKVPYWQRYYEYKKLLTLHAHSSRVQSIFRYADRHGERDVDCLQRSTVPWRLPSRYRRGFTWRWSRPSYVCDRSSWQWCRLSYLSDRWETAEPAEPSEKSHVRKYGARCRTTGRF